MLEHKVSVGLKKKQVIKTSMLVNLLNYPDWIKIFQAFSSATVVHVQIALHHTSLFSGFEYTCKDRKLFES